MPGPCSSLKRIDEQAMKIWWDHLSRAIRHSNDEYPNGKELRGDVLVTLNGKEVPVASYASEEEGVVVSRMCNEDEDEILRGRVSILPPILRYTTITTLGSYEVAYVPAKSRGTYFGPTLAQLLPSR